MAGNKEDWVVSRIDSEGVYHGGIAIPEASSYSVTTPSGGLVRSFNPDTASLGDLMDFVATMAKDLME